MMRTLWEIKQCNITTIFLAVDIQMEMLPNQEPCIGSVTAHQHSLLEFGQTKSTLLHAMDFEE